MKKQHLTIPGLFALLLALAAPALQSQAAILHDTTGGTLKSNWLVGALEVDIDPNDPSMGTHVITNHPADSFVISGGSFFLESLALGLTASSKLDFFGGGPGVDYSVFLWDDSGNGTPGTVLESFTVPDSDSIAGDVELFSTLLPLLTNGSTYWVSAALLDGETSGRWSSIDPPPASSGRASGSNGNSPTWFATSSTDALRLKVTGTPVPEPASLALACVALLLGRLRRR